MKIKSIKLQNFKKFSNLTIDNLPDTVKLVVLLGPNGCGKSSLIESMEVARKIYGLHQIPWSDSNFNYYIKQDRKISKVYRQTRTDIQTTENIRVETQLSKLNFRGTYKIRNLSNPSEVILQQAHLAPQITLDLVKENFINTVDKMPDAISRLGDILIVNVNFFLFERADESFSNPFSQGRPRCATEISIECLMISDAVEAG